MKDSFAERVVAHARPRNVIRDTHRLGLASVLLAIGALADDDKLHVRIPRDYEARRLQQICNSLLGNDPAHLYDDRAVSRNRMTPPKLNRPAWVAGNARKIDSVIDHLKPALRQQIGGRHGAIDKSADGRPLCWWWIYE